MAAGSATARVAVIAEIKQYAEALSKLPGMTDRAAAQAAVKLEQRLAVAQMRAAENASKAAQTAAKRTASELGDVADKLTGINKVSQIFGGVLGPLGGALDDTGDLLEKFGASTAAYAVGAGAAVAAVALEVKALASLASTADDVVRHWDDYVERAGYARDITDVFGASVRDAQEAQDGAAQATARLALRLGGELAPAVQTAYDAWSGLAAGAEDVVVAVDDLADAASSSAAAQATETAVAMGLRAQFPLLSAGYDAVSVSLRALTSYGADRNAQLAEEARLSAEAARVAEIEAAQRLREAQQMAEVLGMPQAEPVAQDKAAIEERKRAADKARQERERAQREAAQAAEALTQITDRYLAAEMDAEGQILDARNDAIEKIGELERASGLHAEAELARLLAEGAAVRDLARIRDDAAQAFQAGVDDQRAAERKAEQARLAAIKAQRRAEADLAEEAAAAAAAYQESQIGAAQSIIGLTGQSIQALIGMMDTQTKEGRNAALALFTVNKGVAVADIAVKTAQATMAALTVPPPAGPILAGANVLAGSIAAGAALAAQPTFHAGRVLAADETGAVLQRHEVVIPAPEVSRQGGPQGVADRLRGKASDGVTILRADFSDRSVLVPLARETRTAGGVPSLYGWASG